jgi:hypothetical protein
LDERRDLRRAQHEAVISIGIALIGDDLYGLFEHCGGKCQSQTQTGEIKFN